MRARERQRVLTILSFVGSAILIGAIIWVDIATGIWQELVILSGLAAGLVTFLLTALVLNRIVARETARRWEPVNRLAVTEFLHAVADPDRSEIAHGIVIPRALPALPDPAAPGLPDALPALRETVAAERRDLADALSRWAGFLTTSGENEDVLRHVAAVALQLDRVRDTALELESAAVTARATGSPAAAPALDARVREHHAALARDHAACNDAFTTLIAELRQRLDAA